MIKLRLMHNFNGLFENKKNLYIFNTGLTVLVGPNGCGKTTLINEIYKYCDGNNIKCFRCDNISDTNLDIGQLNINIDLFTTILSSSNGEGSLINIAYILSEISEYIIQTTNIENNENIVILFDSIDSGLSINNIIKLKELIKSFLKDSRLNNNNIYIIASANTYEMAEGEDCIVTYCSNRHRSFKSYVAYKNFIMKETRLSENGSNK